VIYNYGNGKARIRSEDADLLIPDEQIGLITVEQTAFSVHRRSSLRVREMNVFSHTCLYLRFCGCRLYLN